MITIFTIPKPFNGHIGIIQRNAIQSWKLLHPDCQIMLFGNEKGTADVAKEYNLIHVPEITVNEYGTPLLNDVFTKAQNLSKNDIMCYINADIILLNDFIKSLSRVMQLKKQFLMVGYRYNLDVNSLVCYENGYQEKFLSELEKNGKVFGGIDYFVFNKGILGDIPPFAVGRPGWDNWMIYNARHRKIPVIDCTRAIKAIHQDHDYRHLKDITNRFGNGPEAKKNLVLAGGYDHWYNLLDADWSLNEKKLEPAYFNIIIRPIRKINRKLKITMRFRYHILNQKEYGVFIHMPQMD